MRTRNYSAILAILTVAGALSLAGCNKSEAPAEAAEGEEAPAADDPAVAEQEVGPDGPTSIVLPANLDDLISKADAKKGEELYASKGCKACHNLDGSKLVGPGFDGVSKRHSVPWMARMLLKPEEMVRLDPTARKLLGVYMTPMANQQVNPETELPHLLAFLKGK